MEQGCVEWMGHLICHICCSLLQLLVQFYPLSSAGRHHLPVLLMFLRIELVFLSSTPFFFLFLVLCLNSPNLYYCSNLIASTPYLSMKSNSYLIHPSIIYSFIAFINHLLRVYYVLTTVQSQISMVSAFKVLLVLC